MRASWLFCVAVVAACCTGPTALPPCNAITELEGFRLGMSFREVEAQPGFRRSEIEDQVLLQYFPRPSRFEGVQARFGEDGAIEFAAFREYRSPAIAEVRGLQSAVARELEVSLGKSDEESAIRMGSELVGYADFSVDVWRRECGTIVLLWIQTADLERLLSESGLRPSICVAVAVMTPQRATDFLRKQVSEWPQRP